MIKQINVWYVYYIDMYVELIPNLFVELFTNGPR